MTTKPGHLKHSAIALAAIAAAALCAPLLAVPASAASAVSPWSAGGSDALTWVQQKPQHEPSRRMSAGAPMVYDSHRAETILYATHDGAGRAETWAWDGETWNNLEVKTPSRRSGAVMVYDEARERTVLFGGFVDDAAIDETWVFEDGTWTHLDTATSPPGRYNAAAAYDPVRAEIVLYGGNQAGSHLNDTWTFDGSTWQERTSARRPRSSWGAAMAWDPARSDVVLFGGLKGSDRYPRQTWAWDGSGWAQVATDRRPPGRVYFTMTTVDGRPTIFGGAWSAAGRDLRDTWVLGDAGWRRSVDGPRVKVPAPTMSWDVARDEAVMYGRVGARSRERAPETWTLSPDGRL